MIRLIAKILDVNLLQQELMKKVLEDERVAFSAKLVEQLEEQRIAQQVRGLTSFVFSQLLVQLEVLVVLMQVSGVINKN